MPELDDIRRKLADVDAKLAAAGHTERAAEHREAITQLRQRFEARFESLARAHDAAAGLRRISSRQELLTQAPRALTAETGFTRAILSTIRESVLVPAAAWFDTSEDPNDDADAASAALSDLREHPIRLEHHLVESDVMRRRRAALVTNVAENARVDRRLAKLLGWSSYVVAPLLSGANVIGMVHADRGAAGQLETLDRDVLWEFTNVLSQINESAELRRTLRQEREDLRRFVDRVAALSVSLTDTPITFSAYTDERRPAPILPPVTMPPSGDAVRDDRLVFSGLLTKRELDVLRLLAEGGTNKTIADALVLSATTVKFHVNGILRKLHVANRAEAVSRYLSLLGLPSPQ
jgi:LuxR family transcriptional regulator, regulator of acetate metabolism